MLDLCFMVAWEIEEARVTLWLVFLLLSGVFTLGWALGSAIGYQAGRAEAEELAQLQADLVRSIEIHLADEAVPARTTS
jgi:hypothetical protein